MKQIETFDQFKSWLDQLFDNPTDELMLSADQVPETPPGAPEEWDEYPVLKDGGTPNDFPRYSGSTREIFAEWMNNI